MLSTPVCGVEIRNAVAAPLPAPWLFKETVTGITLQEHKGRGTPKTAALMIGHIPFPPRCLSTNSGETRTDKIPAEKKPKSRYGDISHNVIQNSLVQLINKSVIRATPDC